MLLRSFIVISLGLITFHAFADEGALPRGKSSGPGIKYKISEAKDPDGNCYSYLLNPDQGSIAFNPFAKTAYFIARDKGDGADVKSYVLELNLEKKEVKKKIILKVKDSASIVAHRDPTKAVTILDFKKSTFGCGQGRSAGVGVRWGGQQGVIQTFPAGHYKILRASTGQEVLARADQTVSLFDIDSKQRRVIASLPKPGLPLFLDLNKKESIHFVADEKPALKRFDLEKMKLVGELRLAKTMRLVQQGNRFAVGTIDSKKGEFRVKLLKKWSGTDTQILRFPTKMRPLSKARLSVDFDYGIGLVSAMHREVGREWRHAEIINGNNGRLIRTIKAPPGEYIASLEHFPFSHWAIVITKSIGTDSFGTVSLYHMRDDKVEQIHLSR